ncbi:hypothetical protein [Methylobacterium tarhaniae]|uniref:hypothetical protein n=1 Tax=Methylobacterium tarhaniae TaxID=1187852 RepID=UPI003CFD717A
MTSDRAVEANRRNAKASTGPRTAAGKEQSRQNARKHGLSASGADLEADGEIGRLTELIAGDLPTGPGVREAAHAVAVAQHHLRRVLAVKTALMRADLAAQQAGAEAASPHVPIPSSDLLRDLERLERYERRASSRRKSAVRHLTSLIAASAHPPTSPGPHPPRPEEPAAPSPTSQETRHDASQSSG